MHQTDWQPFLYLTPAKPVYEAPATVGLLDPEYALQIQQTIATAMSKEISHAHVHHTDGQS